MREFVDYCSYDNHAGKRIERLAYNNKIDCNEYNDLFRDKEVEIIIDNFRLDTHPITIYLSIDLNNVTILKLAFNYLEKFYGYTDKWENAVITIFQQEELIDTTQFSITSRKLIYPYYTLYDEKNNFMVKSKNLYQW